MGTSPPSGHAFEVTVNTGPAGPFPRPPPGACAITIATPDMTAIAVNAVVESALLIMGQISFLFGLTWPCESARWSFRMVPLHTNRHSSLADQRAVYA